MKIENNNNYYNVEDEINFEKLKNFRKFNSNVKSITQSNDRNIRYANSDKNYFNNIIKTDENIVMKSIAKYREEFNNLSFDQIAFPRSVHGVEKYSSITSCLYPVKMQKSSIPNFI